MKYNYLFFSILFFIFSCEKDDSVQAPANPGIETSCWVSNIKNESGNTAFKYNSAGLIESIKEYSNGVIDEAYSFTYGNKTSLIYSFTGYVDSNNFVLSSNGLALKAFGASHSPNSKTIDTTFYQFDSNGFLIKSETSGIKYKNGSTIPFKGSSVYTIQNGNIISIVITNTEAGTTITNSTQYTYADTLAKNMGQFTYFKFPALGLTSKNLIQSATSTSPEGSFTYRYSYELDKEGRVTKETKTTKENYQIVRTYEYCN